MKYEIDGEKTIEKYLINIGIITIYYLDGSIENVEYTKENEMAILDEMIRQAKKLMEQEGDLRKESSKYFSLANSAKFNSDIARSFAVVSAPFIAISASGKSIVGISITSLIFLLSSVITFKSLHNSIKYSELEYDLERKLNYITDLETYFEIKEKYEELIANGDEELAKFPFLTINTFDELCKDDTYFEIFSYVKNVMLDEEWEESHKRYYADDEETEMLVNAREVPSISTYNTLDDYHYEHKPKVLSKVLINPFKDLDI